MKTKPSSAWKIENAKIVECIEISCTKPAWGEGLCLDHYDESNREQQLRNTLWSQG